MSGWKKLASAAAASGEVTNVENVFSTHVYTGTDAAQTITNGIDLAGEGGLVWHKARESATNNDHSLFDSETVTGSTFPVVQKAWESNVAGSLPTRQPGFTFTSTGFTTSGRTDGDGTDESGIDYVTWSFRKCPKFFDVVNYTGNSTSGRTISHNLGVVPAMIIVLGQSTGDYWVYHKDVGNTKYLELNKTTAEQTSSTAWNNTTPTDSVFTVGNGVPVNYSGSQYTAYLFADNDGDGEFGPTGDQDIIKCGSYTGDDLDDGPEIDLGFEPQWLMVKNTSTTRNWIIVDNMRGIPTGGNDANLYPNLSNAEDPAQQIRLTPTGFKCEAGGDNFNGNGHTMIYIAIRRGPMAVPESATDVFAIDTFGSTGDGKEPAFRSTFPVDMQIYKSTTGTSPVNTARLTQGKYLSTDTTDAENTGSWAQFDYQNGFYGGNTTTISHYYSWMWRRAPSFFDVVAYTGNAAAGNTIDHNLGVAPEMMWVKRRDLTGSWVVYHKDADATAPEDYYLKLESTAATADLVGAWNDTAPTATEFTLGNWSQVNNTNDYIAYLFASLDGVSKVGSYTGNGSSQTINCGFTAGARFILVKRTDSTGDWYVWDTERGIVAGNDPYLELNTTDAEVTSTDWVDPDNSGFIVNGTTINASSAEYIFYAVA